MMSLVNYDSSDSEEDAIVEDKKLTSNQTSSVKNISQSNQSDTNLIIQPSTSSKANRLVSTFDDDDYEKQISSKFQQDQLEQPSKSAFGLPKPKSLEPILSSSSSSNLFRGIVSSNKKGKVKIFLPSFKNLPDDEDFQDDEEEEAEIKRRRLASSSGCGLTSILPPPKKSTKLSSKSSVTSFMPYSLKSKPATSSALPNAVNKNTSFIDSMPESADESLIAEEDESNEFFSFEQIPNVERQMPISARLPSATISSTVAVDVADQPDFNFNVQSRPEKEEESGEEGEYHQNPTSSKIDENIRLRHLIQSKFGDNVTGDLNIIDVNVNQHLNQNFDYLKTLSEEKNNTSGCGPLPSGQAKRKHQITYLAYQAKQNEVKLKNEWAKNRETKAQAKSRYGF